MQSAGSLGQAGSAADGDSQDGEAGRPAQQGIQSVEIAMRVLLSLEEGRGPMTLSEIAAGSGMQPSKVHRYLVSLGRSGLVAQSRTTGRYDLGPSLRRLGAEALRRMDEVGIASEYLPGLRDRTGHSVNMAVWGEHGPVVVRWDYGKHALPITVRVGATLPLLSSSVGQVYLAVLPRTLTSPLLEGQRLAAGTGQAEVEELKAVVLDNGYATTAGGVIPGLFSVAAPVFTAGDSLPLAVSVAIPQTMATEEEVRQVTDDLLRTTAAMSQDLGVPPSRRQA